jgi:hypothetical protein
MHKNSVMSEALPVTAATINGTALRIADMTEFECQTQPKMLYAKRLKSTMSTAKCDGAVWLNLCYRLLYFSHDFANVTVTSYFAAYL